MKKITLAAIALALTMPTAGVFAQEKMKKDGMNCMDMKGMDMKGMDMKGMNMDCSDMSQKPAAGKQSTHTAKGVVKKIDSKTGMVTVAHEPVESLNWPAMTMDFKVKNKMLLDKFAAGKKVDFEFVKDPNGYLVTAVK